MTSAEPLLRIPAPAKLNLFLHIIGQRADGYHLLQTVFQLLDYSDELSFYPRDDGNIVLASPLAGVADDDNLILKAARRLQTSVDCAAGVTIAVNKRLPMGGGLGGGSSDAATTLLALNRLWQLDLPLDQLAAAGTDLGADVPVFIYGRSAWAEGIGDQLQVIDIEETWYLVLVPDCAVSTAEIFSSKQLTRQTPPITIAAFFGQANGNDCEPVVRALYPEVDRAIVWLERYRPARLTGTGACIFAQFDDQAKAKAVLQNLPPELSGFVARGVNRSPAHQVLGY